MEAKNNNLIATFNPGFTKLDYIDLITYFVGELQKYNKYFKTRCLINGILEHNFKKVDSQVNQQLKKSILYKCKTIITLLKKQGYIEKYNKLSWKILKPITMNSQIDLFSEQKKKILSTLHSNGPMTRKELSEKIELSIQAVWEYINRINSFVKDLILIRKKEKNVNSYCLNNKIFEKHPNLILIGENKWHLSTD